MSFAEISKYLRSEKNISQIELAKALNVSKACISMIEIGRNEPTANTLVRYADFFEVSVDFLLERDNTISSQQKSLINGDKSNNKIIYCNENERKLLSNFRHLTKNEQESILIQTKALADKNRNS